MLLLLSHLKCFWFFALFQFSRSH